MAASHGSPRTTSFFDTVSAPTPSPAARHQQAPSPLNLSRASSVRRAPSRQPESDEPLSPLHQSPTLSPSSSSSWKPPLPPSEDVELRLEASEAYLLGEGRYARVYLASYRGKGKGKEGVPECWTLCAAKRMNVDRESQTMGLREAFFLNRLQSPTRGVYIVKLLAVREQTERRSVHGRSASDLKTVLNRPRSSTEHLSSFPSLPSLHAARDTVSRSTLLLEHAEHGTLDMFLRTSPDLVGDETWIRWARQCSAAVAWTHEKGILHADIKPANLLLTATFDLRLSDFGSSLLIHSSHLPTDGVGLGTLPFSAPELVDPTQTFSFPVDIFALGATLYQCITGKEPYRGLRAMEMMHHVRRGGLWEYEDGQRYNFEVDSRESPYPSAWRDDPGVKRGGSLRLAPSKPKLARNGSAELVKGGWGSSGDLVRDLLSENGVCQERRVVRPAVSIAPPPPEDGSLVFLDGRGRVPELYIEVLKTMLSPEAVDRPTAVELCKIW